MGERAGGPGSGKVTVSHRSRDAIIYVRQSTFTQTQENTESLALQYELRRYATELGWGEDQISVIDDDLARSAASTDGRLGFTDLVAAVGLGRAGASSWAGRCPGWPVTTPCSDIGTRCFVPPTDLCRAQLFRSWSERLVFWRSRHNPERSRRLLAWSDPSYRRRS